jgi:SAM-dependent methyltransferase
MTRSPEPAMPHDVQDAAADLARRFMESRVLLTAAELDVFTVLAEGPLPADEVARRIGGTPRAAAVILDALAAMGLLVKEHGAHRLAPGAEALSAAAPESILPMVLHAASMWQRWSNLTEVVRAARPAPSSRKERTPAQLAAFIGSMQVRARRDAADVVTAVDPGAARRMIDVGGGPGTYALAFLRASDRLQATIVDLPEVIEIARRNVEASGLKERVRLVPVDIARDPLPSGFDLAFVSAIIHMNGPEENALLYRKVYDSLVPGGRIVLRDHVMDPDRAGPLSGTMFAVNMLVSTPRGTTYTLDEISAGLRHAGFDRVRLIRRREMSSLVEAWRPEGGS